MSLGPIEIILGILGISVLVIVHETGHYLVARAFKMRVLRYSIGLGPAIFRYKPKGSPTTFQVCAIPFLAYVQIAGMNPFEEIDPKDPEIFPNKSLFARIATIAAGPAANYLAAVVLAFFLALGGWPTPKTEPTEPMVIGTVVDGSAAEEAGLAVGDVVLEANGRLIRNVEELIEVTSPRAGQPTTYVIEHEGERRTVTLTPRDDGNGKGKIGVAPEQQMDYVQHSVPDAAKKALWFPVELTGMTIASLMDFDPDDIAGPKRMGEAVAKSAQQGLPSYVHILIVLSIALGFFNLLPFPALDGGRLAFLGYELITRKRANARFETIVHTVGIVVLLSVLVWVTYREIAG
jgi:regulator of sigma E protease